MTNRLSDAASAYLRSAAHQPIHWYPWSAEAFAAAARDDRPVLLDIGAVWCHWCHVMDGESYENAALAEYLNAEFVCIKVDRDERPDVDVRYQRAVQAITGQGGWPLTAFLTPDGQVFYGGTYFPPDGKYGRPGFRSVLEQVRQVYHTQRERVEQQALALRRVLASHAEEAAPGTPSAEILTEAAHQMAAAYDARNGGFGSAPKFPHPAAVTFLLTRWADTGEETLRDVASHTLLAMARGGMHDHLGGGFHRYSVDAQWIVPHFEKMSYDNAGLLQAYLDGLAVSGEPLFSEAARGIVRWVQEVLADPDGGYGASQDADVGLHDDGDYFTWTLDEARDAIGDEALLDVAATAFDIGTAGEMHHNPSKNVLFLAADAPAIGRRLGISADEAGPRLAEARRRLRAARERRTAPFVDRARYTAWNGMLAAALIRAGCVLDDAWAGEHGLATLRRLRSEQDDDAALQHSPGGVGGLLEDQVQVALAAIEALESTGEGEWLDWAARIMDRVWRDYDDQEGGGLFDTASRTGEGLLPARMKPVQDAPTPSANGIAAIVCARLAEHTGRAEWGERRDAILSAFADSAAALGIHGATLLQAMDWALAPATHIVIVEGSEPGARETADAMLRAALGAFLPRRVVRRLRGPAVEAGGLPPALAAMLEAGTRTRAYACAGARCEAPAESIGQWGETLARLVGLPRR